jgi:hypothetical protein
MYCDRTSSPKIDLNQRPLGYEPIESFQVQILYRPPFILFNINMFSFIEIFL